MKRTKKVKCRYGKNGYFGICGCEECSPPKVMSKLNPEVPRRAMIPEWCDAERAIQDAVNRVEAMGASPSLTHAVILLGDARNAVADHYDHTIRKERSK